MLMSIVEQYHYCKKVYEIEKKAGLSHTLFSILIRKWKIYKQHKRAFEIGKRAAQGYNIYLTFGSEKTVTKSAEDSYRRYSMAMKHYNQALCDINSFILGYNQIKKVELS